MHHKTITKTTLALMLGVGALTSAQAGDTRDYKSTKNVVEQMSAPAFPRFYFWVDGGADVDFNATKFISNGGGHLLDEPARVDARYYGKTHDVTWRLDATFGYNINPVISVFGRFEYEHAYTSRENVGRIRDIYGYFGADLTRNYNISVDLKDYETFGGKAGVRIAPPIPEIPFVKPYITFAVGGKYVENISGNFAVNEGGATPFGIGDVRLYDDCWVFSTDIRLGVEYDLTRNLALTVEGGIAYDSKPKHTNTDLEALGLTGVNKGGERLYAPLTAGIKYSF